MTTTGWEQPNLDGVLAGAHAAVAAIAEAAELAGPLARSAAAARHPRGAPEWQQPTTLDLAAEGDAAAAFDAIVLSVPYRTPFTVNDLRDRLDAAGIPPVKRGRLFTMAIERELIEPVMVNAWGRDYEWRIPSTGKSAHRATVRVYRRRRPDGDEEQEQA